MIECIYENGSIIAVAEWMMFDEKGAYDEDGENMVIFELEIAPKWRSRNLIKEIVSLLLRKAPKAETCTWVREKKYPYRGYRTYNRNSFERLIRGKSWVEAQQK